VLIVTYTRARNPLSLNSINIISFIIIFVCLFCLNHHCAQIFSVAVSCIDTDLHESEKAFESEFNKLYGDKEDEQKAGNALLAAEKQVNSNSKVIAGPK
jgi:hypothetical protein